MAWRAGGRQEGSAFDHDRDMTDTDSCISDGEYLGEPCDSFDDTDGGHLPHIHYHERYNYLPMTEDMAEHVRLDAWRVAGSQGPAALLRLAWTWAPGARRLDLHPVCVRRCVCK